MKKVETVEIKKGIYTWWVVDQDPDPEAGVVQAWAVHKRHRGGGHVDAFFVWLQRAKGGPPLWRCDCRAKHRESCLHMVVVRESLEQRGYAPQSERVQ